MSRLFVCLWPPSEVAARLEELHRKDQDGVRFVRPENWHITLRFLGQADPNDVAGALDHADFEPTTIRLGPAVDVLSGRVLVVPARGAEALADEVVRVTAEHTTQPLARRSAGHLTIARLKRPRTMPRALGELIDASWRPDEVALVESRTNPDGARYETLATWPIESLDSPAARRHAP